MDILKIELYRYERLVFGKIVHQDERLRCGAIVESNERFGIESQAAPELDFDKLFIRGRANRDDDRAFCYHYPTIEKAIEVCNDIKKLVNIINGRDIVKTEVEQII